MNTEIAIKTLEPIWVASFYGFGKEPETIAWTKFEQWAKSKNIWQKFETYPVFGFNIPDPTPASPNYGYEVWVVIDKEIIIEEDIETKRFDGGLYAVTRCPVPKGNYDVIGQTWRKLVAWREQSQYAHANHQWLEKSVPNSDPAIEFILDLYLPIKDPA